MNARPRAGAAPIPGLAATLALAVLACAALPASRAAASVVGIDIAVPDSAGLAALRVAVARAPALRVVGEFGKERIPEPILDSSGVRSARWEPTEGRRTALFSAGRTEPVAAREPIPWDRISALEAGRSKTLQGAVGGTIVGLVVGAGIALAVRPRGYVSETEAYLTLGIVRGTTLAGTLVGAVIGSRSGFRRIYPAEAAGNPTSYTPVETHDH